MRFNHKRELQEFMADWEAQEAIMRQHGMDDEAISALFDHDYRAFNATRQYYRQKEEFVSEQSEAEYLHAHAMDKTALIGPEDLVLTLELFDQIENPALLNGLKALKKADLEVFLLFAVEGLSGAEIGRRLGQTQQNVSLKILRAKNILKNFL